MKSFLKVPDLFLEVEMWAATEWLLFVIQSILGFLFFLMPLFPLILILPIIHVFFHFCSHFLLRCFLCFPNSVNSGYADKWWLSKMPGKVYYLPTSFFHFLYAWIGQWACTLNYRFLFSSDGMKLWYGFGFHLLIR